MTGVLLTSDEMVVDRWSLVSSFEFPVSSFEKSKENSKGKKDRWRRVGAGGKVVGAGVVCSVAVE